MRVQAVCQTDHTATGGTSGGYVMETFDSQQSASNRGLEESYPHCNIEYIEEKSE